MSQKKNDLNTYPVALTIAGSDSGGGAGIQADLRTFNALGVFGCSAITAITSQNPHTVNRVDGIPAAGVTAQIDTILEAINVKWCKSGMLFSAEIVEATAASIKRHNLYLVCDPVMVSTSGAKLLDTGAIDKIRTELLPLAKWITPNLSEAELLLETTITTIKEADIAAKKLYDKFGASILLKGGHAKSKRAGDVVCHEGKLWHLSSPRVAVPELTTHGTGCTLSAALTALFALDTGWKAALCDAKAFVLGSLQENVLIGKNLQAMYPPTEDMLDHVILEVAQ